MTAMYDVDDAIPTTGWGITPPWWDERPEHAKRIKADGWVMYFIQVNSDGGETYHFGHKPRGFAALRVGRCGDIEQTATWDKLPTVALPINPATPPGEGWKLHKMCFGYHLWRREALLKKAA